MIWFDVTHTHWLYRRVFLFFHHYFSCSFSNQFSLSYLFLLSLIIPVSHPIWHTAFSLCSSSALLSKLPQNVGPFINVMSLFLDCQTCMVFSRVLLSSTDGQCNRSSQWDAVLALFLFLSLSTSVVLFSLWPRGNSWVRLMCVYSSLEKWGVVCV